MALSVALLVYVSALCWTLLASCQLLILQQLGTDDQAQSDVLTIYAAGRSV